MDVLNGLKRGAADQPYGAPAASLPPGNRPSARRPVAEHQKLWADLSEAERADYERLRSSRSSRRVACPATGSSRGLEAAIPSFDAQAARAMLSYERRASRRARHLRLGIHLRHLDIMLPDLFVDNKSRRPWPQRKVEGDRPRRVDRRGGRRVLRARGDARDARLQLQQLIDEGGAGSGPMEKLIEATRAREVGSRIPSNCI